MQPRESTHDIRTSDIMRVVNQKGCMSLTDIGQRMLGSRDKLEMIWNTIAAHLNCFCGWGLNKPFSEIVPDATMVFVKSPINLCDKHVTNSVTCDGNCHALHTCRKFLLRSESDCPFSRKNKCKFGHSLTTSHNRRVLKEVGLDTWSLPEVRSLFKWRQSRSFSTLPPVCIYYNCPEGKQCTKERCQALHICAKFLRNECAGGCSRNHSLMSKQMKEILDQFAIEIGGQWTEDLLKKDLLHTFEARQSGPTKGSSGSDSSNDSDEEDGAAGVVSGKAAANDDDDDDDSNDDVRPRRSTKNERVRAKSSSEAPLRVTNESCAGCTALASSLLTLNARLTTLEREVKEMKHEAIPKQPEAKQKEGYYKYDLD